MKNLIARVLVLGLMTEFAMSCGETINYDTEEKVANALFVPDSNAGGDAVVATEPTASPDTNVPNDTARNDSIGNEIGADGLPAACGTRTNLLKQENLVFPEIAPGTTCSFGSDEAFAFAGTINGRRTL